MNFIAKSLLGGAALCALATVPAVAGDVRAFHVTALYDGNVVNKTGTGKIGRKEDCSRVCVTTISTYVPASELNTTVKLFATYYKWNSNLTICSSPKEKIKVDPKKTQYAKIGTATETYSLGCASGPTTFYGDTYRLTNPAGEGHTDTFFSKLTGKFKNGGVKYKGTINLDVFVAIGN